MYTKIKTIEYKIYEPVNLREIDGVSRLFVPDTNIYFKERNQIYNLWNQPKC